MAATRIHHPLPAPVVHAGFSAHQSKSTVLAGVQDAYWSDDEGEEVDCPLCLEEMDISDRNFKPCVCGYQICRFCWHHIKENLNGRCPACRRVYTDEAVEFKPIDKDDHKRMTQQKKQKERERKELEALGRRQLANVRVVQRNVVYVVGIAARFAKEELIPTLRSNEFFGQYGKITKMVLVKRTPSGGAPVVGLYITYNRREDAARCISAVDGTAPQGGGRDDVMRASYGTTKYCMAFLRGASCNDHSCMNLHEWGDEKDCFTKEDLTTLKHTMKATERRSRASITVKKSDETDGLPRAASWGQKAASVTSSQSLAANTRQSRRGTTITLGSGGPPRTIRLATASSTSSETKPSSRSSQKSTASSKLASAATSRPSTPSTITLPAKSAESPTASTSTPVTKPVVPEVKVLKQKEPDIPVSPSPAPSTAADSDYGSGVPASPPPPVSAEPTAVSTSASTPDLGRSPEPVPAVPALPVAPSVPAAPPGLTSPPPGLMSPPPPGLGAPPGLAPPPGLSAPPGLTRSAPTRVDTASPQTPLLAFQSSYQMSDAARALLDDVQNRRHFMQPTVPALSPFPDFDRTLETLGDTSGGFSFNLDPKLAGDDSGNELAVLNDTIPPYQGSFLDAFPGLKEGITPPPQMIPGYGHSPNGMYNPSGPEASQEDKGAAGEGAYSSVFNPFADGGDDSKKPNGRSGLGDDGTPKMSRFGFARPGRRMSSHTAAAHTPSPLQHASSASSLASSNISSNPLASDATEHAFYASDVTSPPRPHRHDVSPFSMQAQQQAAQASPVKSSPLIQHAHAQALYAQQQQQQRLQSYESSVSEAQLRDLIQNSRARGGLTEAQDAQLYKMTLAQSQQFSDPAIMSARFGTPMMNPPGLGYSNMDNNHNLNQLAYGPPPGIGYQHYNGGYPQLAQNNDGSASNVANPSSLAPRPVTPAVSLSPSEFPALTATTETSASNSPVVSSADVADKGKQSAPDLKSQELAEKRAAKRAAAAERQAERQRLAREKAEAKAVEKTRIAQEKQAEKEKTLAEEKAAKEKAAKEKADKDRQAKERAEKARKEREAELAEKERLAKIEKEKALATAAAKEEKQAQKKAKPTGKALGKAADSHAANPDPEPTQAALLSKKPKKYKPVVAKPARQVKEDDPTSPALSSSEAAAVPGPRHGSGQSSSANSRSQSVDASGARERTSVEELLEEIEMLHPGMDLLNHPFFDVHKINAAIKMPLEYGPLVHALSALSVGGGSFANNLPSGSIDNAVSSFQQLLETLTQTISDLLRLLPRTTWDDSSSFDGVLRDMLKGDDFLDDGGEENQGKEDEVATLTLALERRARWMEVQLSKLEELHRDINTAAVRAVLSFNDNGWDRSGFLPRVGNTLKRFDSLGMKEENGVLRPMTADEMEGKLLVAKEVAVFAETELREQMEYMLEIKPMDID